MAHINLLPWRQWERERKKNEFLANLAGVLVLGAVMVFSAGWYLDDQITTQQSRNQFLRGKIAVLDERIAEIRSLEAKRVQLLERMRVIQDLQGNRPIIVRVFDELVQTLARGVHYESLSLRDKTLSVTGTAESNNRISSLMRNIDASAWFADPNLKQIKETNTGVYEGDQVANFELSFRQVKPKVDEEGE
ncbi:MAG: PilN domain-containing protein [Gammaproteobacteria bacterium]|nr:PilN domain-containing protein [Gammaproteobacteria bacterium]